MVEDVWLEIGVTMPTPSYICVERPSVTVVFLSP
jgi:hypothetical protein